MFCILGALDKEADRDSSGLFQGLAIMDTEYAACINSRPVLLIDEYDQPIMSSYEHFSQFNNPWSILNYADNGFLDNYWVNTSANFLIRKGLKDATRDFWKDFDVLVTREPVTVWLTLDTSNAERDSDASLWGLVR